MGFYKNDATAANNTSVNGIAIQGSSSPANIDNALRELAAQGKQFALDIAGANTVGGTADAITITANDSVADAYFDGMIIGFVAGSDNATTAPTANVNAIGAKTIKKALSINGTEIAVAAGDIKNGCFYLLRYRSAWASAAGAWQLIDLQHSNAAERGYIYGLTLSNNSTDATNDIDIAAGQCASDDTSPVLLTLASALTKRLDAAWAVGTGNGGRTGSIDDKTYHVWLIRRSDTGVVDALFSASATSPTMPTNYDQKRRIGSIIRASGAIKAFVQTGDIFLLSTPVVDRNSVSARSAALLTVSVPWGIKCFPIFKHYLQGNSGTGAHYLGAAVEGNAVHIVNTIGDTGFAQSSVVSPPVFETNTSRQVYYRTDTDAGIIGNTLVTSGWVDLRGRDK